MFQLIDITKEILQPFKRCIEKIKWLKYEPDTKKVGYVSNVILGLE